MNIFSSFLGILKSGFINKVNFISSPYNKKVLNLCLTLLELGYISGYTIYNNKRLVVFLKYYKGLSVIRSIGFVSKSSHRVYIKKKNVMGRNLHSHIRSNSFMLFSTSSNAKFLTDVECLMYHTGGEPTVVIR